MHYSCLWFFAKINYVKIHVIRRQRRLRLRRQLLLRMTRRVVAAKSRCWTLQPSPPTTTGYFLVADRVVAVGRFFEVCHEEYGVDLRTKLFRCDRQVTYIIIIGLRGAYQGHKRHSLLNNLITGTWSLKYVDIHM